jgi:glycosyltransferase involved in cell wall biosynthesis
MVPLEAQACGRPVIAFGAGGSLETLRGTGSHRTGVYFAQQTVESVMEGILKFEADDRSGEFIPQQTQLWAAKFATPLFLERMRQFILSAVPSLALAMIDADSASPI